MARFFALIVCFGAGALGALAQPTPQLTSVSPEWIQRGVQTPLTFVGENLEAVSRVIVSGAPGIAVELSQPAVPIAVKSSSGGISSEPLRDSKRLSVVLSADSDAALETRELRVVTPWGVSNPVILKVGHLAEVAEAAGAKSMESPQRLTAPAIVTGKIGGGSEIDFYAWTAEQEAEQVVEVTAAREGSKLDSSLVIFTPSGKELARNEDEFGFDSFVLFKAPETGVYTVALRDFQFRGGGEYRYRLAIGQLPFVRQMYPLGGERGKRTTVALSGANLGGVDKVVLDIAPDAAGGIQEMRAETPVGISNPFPFHVGEGVDQTEVEPNEVLEKANLVIVPGALNGRIHEGNNRDYYKFKARKGLSLTFELMASRFGSPLDALLTLYNSKGEVVARNDDAGGKDARLERQFGEDGEYYLSVEDLLGRGGEAYSYRLDIREPRPDFTVQCLPDNPVLHRGSQVPIRFEVTRVAGFGEVVRIESVDLPAGLHMDPVVLLSDGPQAATVFLEASGTAELGSFPIQFRATSEVGGSTVTHRVIPLSKDRPVREMFVTILDGLPFRIHPLSISVAVEQGGRTELPVYIERLKHPGELQLVVEGYSTGRDAITRSLEIPAATVKKDESRTALILNATTSSELGTRPIWIKAMATVEDRAVVAYSAPVPLTIHSIPFVLSTTLKRVGVTALPPDSGSSAGEAFFVVKAERRSGFTGAIEVEIEGVPEGITATVEPIGENKNESTIHIKAGENAPAGKEFDLIVRGRGSMNDRTFRHQAAPVKLSVSAPAAIESSPATAAK